LVFLFHYPILLATGAVVHHLWPASVSAAAGGLLAAWGVSAAAGGLLAAWGMTLLLAHRLEYREPITVPTAMLSALGLLALAEAV
jgi:hypothetical protein